MFLPLPCGWMREHSKSCDRAHVSINRCKRKEATNALDNSGNSRDSLVARFCAKGRRRVDSLDPGNCGDSSHRSIDYWPARLG